MKGNCESNPLPEGIDASLDAALRYLMWGEPVEGSPEDAVEEAFNLVARHPHQESEGLDEFTLHVLGDLNPVNDQVESCWSILQQIYGSPGTHPNFSYQPEAGPSRLATVVCQDSIPGINYHPVAEPSRFAPVEAEPKAPTSYSKYKGKASKKQERRVEPYIDAESIKEYMHYSPHRGYQGPDDPPQRHPRAWTLKRTDQTCASPPRHGTPPRPSKDACGVLRRPYIYDDHEDADDDGSEYDEEEDGDNEEAEGAEEDGEGEEENDIDAEQEDVEEEDESEEEEDSGGEEGSEDSEEDDEEDGEESSTLPQVSGRGVIRRREDEDDDEELSRPPGSKRRIR